MSRLSYDVVIATSHTDPLPQALDALARLPREERPRRVILAVGARPAEQRNLATALCSSPLVYYLDDDSSPIQGTPTLLAEHFEEGRTAVAGGPNLCPPEADPFQWSLSAVLASWMGSFSIRYRYASLGSVKEATEKELILCNLMIRRETFLKAGGFRTDLYPNEENEFLNRLLHHGYSLMYSPQAAVYRPRRHNLKAFLWQCFRYGRGRAQQMRVYPCLSDLVHLVPAFFVLYLFALVGLWAFPGVAPETWVRLAHGPWGWGPLALFAALAAWTGVSSVSWHRRTTDLVNVPLLIFFRHVMYGFGLFAGAFTPLHPRDGKPILLYEAVRAAKGWKLRQRRLPSAKEPS